LKITVIGCGGVGLRVAPEAAMWLAYDPLARRDGKVPMLTLIDGDAFEERNKARQAFARIGNKAEVAAEALADQYSGLLHVEAEPEYIGRKNNVRLIREGDVVLCCVDKFSARKLISDRASGLSDCLVIAGGNDYTDGSVQIYLRQGGKDLTLPLANEYHSEVLNPPDDNPGDRAPGCDVEVTTGENAQLGITNLATASSMLNAFYRAVKGGKKMYDEVYFDIDHNQSRTESRGPAVRDNK